MQSEVIKAHRKRIQELEEKLAQLESLEHVEHLETALKNAVSPSYDIHTTCEHCGKEGKSNNGEWLIWCGPEKHAKAVLKAAQNWLEFQGKKKC